MLTTEQKNQIAKLLRIDAAKLNEALTSTEEVTLELPEGIQTVTEEELTRVKNAEYNSGKTKGVEMAVKETREKLGLESQSKTIEGLIEAAAKKALADAQIEPSKKVEELQKDNSILRQQIDTLNSTIADKDNAVVQAKVDRELFKEVPQFENGMEADDFIQYARVKGYDFKLEENKLVAYKNGEPVKSNLAEPIPVKDVLTSFAKDMKFITDTPAPSGRGEGDRKPTATFSKLSELTASFKEQGKSTQGKEFMDKVREVQKQNPEFDVNS